MDANSPVGMDTDSAIGTLDSIDATESLAFAAHEFQEENGRTYHGYNAGMYPFPNDKAEKDRLDLQHSLVGYTLGNLIISPIEKPIHRILDVGTGTGIWAIDVAVEYPEAMVKGVDLSPIQPEYIPPNVEFEIDNLEGIWTTDTFNLIHASMMGGSFKNWPKFFAQSFKNLEKGGYIEMVDTCYPFQFLDETAAAPALHRFSDLMLQSASQSQNYKNTNSLVYSSFAFRVVIQKLIESAGRWTLLNMEMGLYGFCIALFTRQLGWSKEEVEVFLVDVRKEMKNRRVYAYLPLYIVYAQKP